MDHAKELDKEPTARKLITIFSMNRKTLPTEQRGHLASIPNASKTTKQQPELITWEELIGKR
jgi:hypothetical protein